MASYFSDIDSYNYNEYALRLLLSCAEAIEDGNLKSADASLQNILILADEKPKLKESKVVKYFADALVRRAYGLHPASSYFIFPVDPAPFYLYNSYRINGVIKKVIDDAFMGNRRLHLIDFSIPYYDYVGSVLRTLPTFSGDPPPVRVSYILPPFLNEYLDFSYEMEFLTRDAEEVNVKLEDEFKVVCRNSLAEVYECEIDLKRRRDDEMVVVYYKFKLHKLVRDAKAMERELVRLQEINPTIVILLDFYSNHTHPNFLTYLKDSFQFYFNTCKFWRQSSIGADWEYWWDCNRDASEGNNIIRRHQTLSEWQRLFSTAGFTRIPLSHEKDDLIDSFSTVGFGDDSVLEIMREEEECLILGYEGCPLFFLSAWIPKVEDGHFNSISTNHKFGEGFNPNPLPLQPFQPFLEGLTLNRLVAVAEIHDISKCLCCKYNLSFALTTTSINENMNETMWDPSKDIVLYIQDNSCYIKDIRSYEFLDNEIDMIHCLFDKAFESGAGYHFEPSITKLDVEHYPYSQVKKYNIDVVVAICLQNRHTSNEVYMVQFYWPATESEISESLALCIFEDLKHMKTRFVTVKVQGTEIKFQEEAISSIPTSSNTAMPLKKAEEARDIHAIEINGHIEQGVVPNFDSPISIHSSSKVVAAPFNTLEGPDNQIVSNGDPEIGKANKEKLPRTKQRNSRPKTGKANKEKLPRTKQRNSRPKTVKANKEKLPETTQRRLTSKVWEHFDRLLVGQGQVAKCKHCSKVLTGSSNSGTSHLRNHLNGCQKEQNQERRRLNYVKMIIKHGYSLGMADQEFFKNFGKDMPTRFEFPSKEELLSDIHRIYKEEKEKLQLYFDKLASKFNLTVSLWNNSGKTAYCCLIAHFIDDSWELKMKTLGLRTLEDIYDTKAVGGIIQSLVSEWNIGSKVCSITVDNCFLDDSMIQQIKENCLSAQTSLSSAHWFISFTLLEDGFREMDDLLFKLKKSIRYVKQDMES